MNTTLRIALKSILPCLLLAGLYACSHEAARPAPPPSDKPVAEKPKASESRPVARKQIKLKASHPLQYTVKRGDTLWDIASLFLKDPWYWPEIWEHNPQIHNPHRIYPGDVLTLVYVDGMPRLQLSAAASRNSSAGPLPVKKLHPGIRSTALDASIPSIPSDAIAQFLAKPRVVTKAQMDSAPYIVASDERHLILGSGGTVYVRGEIDKERVRFAVFHPGRPLKDPETDEVLGYEAKYAGDLRITRYADPATGELTFTQREVLLGDRLLPEDKSKTDSLYFPRRPDLDIHGRIVSLYDALFGVGQYQIVVINRGERDGLEVGHLLAAYNKGDTVRDRFAKKKSIEVDLPDERSGLIMIFKLFDRVSYGLVLENTRVIHRNDVVATPPL